MKQGTGSILKSILKPQPHTKALAGAILGTLLSISSTEAATLDQVLNSKAVQFLQDKWQDLKLKGDLGVSPKKDISNSGFISGDIGYKFSIQPALQSDYQQRQDVYYIGASIGGSEVIQAGVKGSLQVSFSKLIVDKTKALLRAPTRLTDFPRSATEILEKMEEGDAARIELSTRQFMGPGFLNAVSPSNISIKAQYERGSNFIVEVYRLKENKVRTRFISTHNTGALTGGFTLKPYIDFGILDGLLNGALSCKPIELIGKKGVGALPIDTMVLDYILDFDDPTTVSAYNNVFDQVRFIDIQKQLLALNNPQDYQGGLWSIVQSLESFYSSQSQLPEDQKTIKRIFKSRMLSEQIRTDLNSSCFKLWKLQGQEGHSVSSVRTYDFNDSFNDYLYLRSENQNEQSFIRDRHNSEGRRDLEMLFSAYRDASGNPASVNLVELTDFSIRTDAQEARLSQNEFYQYLKDFNYQFGVYKTGAYTDELLKMATTRKDIRLKTQLNVNPYILKNLPKRTAAEYTALVSAYVRNHPVPNMIPTTINHSNDDRDRAFDYDIKRIGPALQTALDPATSTADFYKIMRNLRKNKMYQFISAGFLIALVPASQRDVAFRFSYSLEMDKTVVFHFDSDSSRQSITFDKISNIVSAINERSFDVEEQLAAKIPSPLTGAEVLPVIVTPLPPPSSGAKR